ncbi:MAG TPA: hypothetical protein VFG79_06825, partial [Solirubrobacter sp.]|nr:hypothetical protein [Solirubrobacter sp.]
TTSESAGGDALMAIILTGLVLVVAGISAFIAFATWWLLPFAMLGLLVSAAGIIYSIALLIDTGSPIPHYQPKPRTEAELAPAEAPVRIKSAAVASH